MISWLDDPDWNGFGIAEDVPEENLNLDTFDDIEQEEEKKTYHIVYCLLTEDRQEEFAINTPFCNLQKEIYTGNEGNTIYRSVIFGDGEICRVPFETAEDDAILYLSETVRAVPPSQILMEADSILKDRLLNYPEEKGILIIIRESDRGLQAEEERLLKDIFSGSSLPYEVILVENKRQDDWLEFFAGKQQRGSYLYDEIDDLIRKGGICQ